VFAGAEARIVDAMWARSSNPGEMLDFLPAGAKDPRKARLLAVACCRRFSPADPRCLAAVEVAERFADGQASEEERRAAETAAREARLAVWPHLYAPQSTRVARAYSVADAFEHVVGPSEWFFTEFDYNDSGLRHLLSRLAGGAEDARGERRAQAELLRDIFGDPFRPAPEVPTFGPRRAQRVAALAADIYSRRSFDRLPELADVLKSAGCRDQRILSHCRSPAAHARACWVVDLLLGKA
jgi:hypothetical protein